MLTKEIRDENPLYLLLGKVSINIYPSPSTVKEVV